LVTCKLKPEYSAVLDFLPVMLLSTGANYPSHFSVRLVQQSSAFLFMVVHIGYCAKLTSLAALHRPQPPLAQLADILKSSRWKFGVMNASLVFDIFKASCKYYKFLIHGTWKVRLQTSTDINRCGTSLCLYIASTWESSVSTVSRL